MAAGNDSQIPPRRETAFEPIVTKLRELQSAQESTDLQLAVIDWWIAQLHLLAAKIRAGDKI